MYLLATPLCANIHNYIKCNVKRNNKNGCAIKGEISDNISKTRTLFY